MKCDVQIVYCITALVYCTVTQVLSALLFEVEAYPFEIKALIKGLCPYKRCLMLFYQQFDFKKCLRFILRQRFGNKIYFIGKPHQYALSRKDYLLLVKL